ncbi:MAG: hypothetical protein BHV66_03995 [Alistipes putredinis]|uniref:Uncharacterized protein n=1 Tax=Alistipes putredinis TaxID=28117 RepID=A0A1Q6F9V2_9BACT|nr:hypothetical protein [Alistipes putredinis]OKY95472.1 MAG: hypothetical protein BHV66_03995 [Alistipes putredinis]
MTNLSYRQAMLIKHTAWMNTRLLARGPRPEDERYVPLAVRMLTLVGCLNYAMLDLESELTASGLFHHETKRRYTQAQTLVTQAHGIAWSMLRKIDDRAARQYNDKTDEAYRTISGCILLEAPQRSYNIVLSLCRIISSLNGRISGRYDFNPAKPLVRIQQINENEKIHTSGFRRL